MEQSTIDDLKRESAFRRKRAMTDNAVADKIDQIVDALIDEIRHKGVMSPSEFRMVHERQERLTQADVLERAMKKIGRPAPLQVIAVDAIELEPRLKGVNVDNLRSVMSRDDRFKSYGGGIWGLAVLGNPPPRRGMDWEALKQSVRPSQTDLPAKEDGQPTEEGQKA